MTEFLKSYDGGLVARLCSTLVTPWTIACQAPLSMGFPRQEYWSCRFLLQGIFLSPALAGKFFTTEPPGSSYIDVIAVFT